MDAITFLLFTGLGVIGGLVASIPPIGYGFEGSYIVQWEGRRIRRFGSWGRMIWGGVFAFLFSCFWEQSPLSPNKLGQAFVVGLVGAGFAVGRFDKWHLTQVLRGTGGSISELADVISMLEPGERVIASTSIAARRKEETNGDGNDRGCPEGMQEAQGTSGAIDKHIWISTCSRRIG